jgi:predicted acetyltransferase
VVRTQTVTILFCDLVKSTERRARLGDDEFDEFTGRFMATLRDAISHHGPRGVERRRPADGRAPRRPLTRRQHRLVERPLGSRPELLGRRAVAYADNIAQRIWEGHDALVTLDVELAAATLEDKSVVRHLLELYVHDFSEFTAEDVDEHGLFGYPDLDQYWTQPDRHPFLIRAGGHIAGLAFVRSGQPHDMAEFFILRKYRGRGVGVQAAQRVFAMFPGDWQVRQLAANTAATAFWRIAIPVSFSEDANQHGPVQHFRVGPEAT